MRDQDQSDACWFQHFPALAMAAIWGLNQWMKHLSLTLLLLLAIFLTVKQSCFGKRVTFFSPWFFRLSNRPSDKLLQCSKQKGQSQPETQSLNLKPGFSTGCGAPRYLSHFYAFQNPEIHGGFRHSDVGIHGLTHVLTTRWKTHPFCTSFQCWTITSKFGIFDFFKLLTWSNFFPNENLSMM